MERGEYLVVMGLCLLITLLLELLLGARVWRRPRRLLVAMAPLVLAYSIWDIAMIAAGSWSYSEEKLTGILLPFEMPLEELVFFIVVPIFAPPLIMQGVDPIWLGVAMAIVLQTSYLTPPFGFAIFYLQGATKELGVGTIYRGVIPFVLIQLLLVAVIWLVPGIVSWLPRAVF